jgi:polyferredoxin
VALHPLQDSLFGGNEEHFVWMVAGIGAWLGWTIPFGIVVWRLNRRHGPAPSSISQLTNTSPV